MSLAEKVRALREAGDISLLSKAIPYANFMGIEARLVDGEVQGLMRNSDHLVGNATVGALHGGTLGALMESTAIFKLLWQGESNSLPKIINITVEFLRGAKKADTHAKAEFTRHGRRVANVRVTCWQDDQEKPVAVATTHFLLVDDD